MLTTARSGLPSPSKSAAHGLYEVSPTAKPTGRANNTLPGVLRLRNTATLSTIFVDTAMSFLPSPSKSAIANAYGPGATGEVVTTTLVAKEMEPGEEVFLNTDRLRDPRSAVIISSLPSPSTSANFTLLVKFPVVRMPAETNDELLIVPGVLVFLRICTFPGGLLLFLLFITRSGFPSPSRSPTAVM